MDRSGITERRRRCKTSRSARTFRGLFYLSELDDQTPLPDTFYRRKTPEWEFRRCFRVEDDFTFYTRQKQLWRIDSVDLATKKLTATLLSGGQPVGDGKPKTFDLRSSTRVFQGKELADLAAIQPGQTVLFSLTWATLYGPGRIMDIWLDDESRNRALARQMEVHRNYIRERGLPGWVTEVDDKQQLVTITFFGGVDPNLFEELTLKDVNAPPPKDGSPPPVEPLGRLAVARDTLMTFDPVNDSKRGSLLAVKKIPVEPGSSGVQVTIKVDMMLEGYRPRRVVRYYPETWKVVALPSEESLFGRE